MMFLILLIGLGRGFAMSFPIHMHSYDAMDCVHMDSIPALNFQSGSMTAGRRLAPVPQLSCSNCSKPLLRNVECTRRRQHASTWTCFSNAWTEMTILPASITCEGCSSPSDPFILKGSCRLLYHESKSESESVRVREESREESRVYDVAAVLVGLVATIVCFEKWNRRWMTAEERELEAVRFSFEWVTRLVADHLFSFESATRFVAQSVPS